MILADAKYANFSGANFSMSLMQLTNFFQSDFSGANLTGAQFSYAMLSHANFKDAVTKFADFYGASLSQTTLPDGSVTPLELSNDPVPLGHPNP